MKTLTLPKEFHNEVPYQAIENGRLVSKVKTVSSKTSELSVPYNGPLMRSFEDDNKEEKRVLSIRPGETRKFEDDEAAFLMDLYPYLLEASEGQLGDEDEEEPEDDGEDDIPTNYMKLKKYAKERGVDVLKTDKKEDILKKLKQLKK